MATQLPRPIPTGTKAPALLTEITVFLDPQIATLNGTIATQGAALTKANSDLAAANAAIAQLTLDLAESQAEVTNLTNEAVILNTQIAALTESLDAANADKAGLQALETGLQVLLDAMVARGLISTLVE